MALTRTIWQDLYGMELDMGQSSFSTHVGADPDFAAASIGIQGAGANGKFGLPLTDHPNFKSPSATVDTEEARGISTRHDDEFNIAVSGEPVEFAIPMLGNAYNVAGITALLFQSGGVEDSPAGQVDMHRFTGTPYTGADTDNFAYFMRAQQPNDGSDDCDLLVKGAICSSLTFTGEAGGLLTIEPTIQAAKWEQANCASGGGGKDLIDDLETNGIANISPLKYQDSTVGIEYSGGNWADVFVPSMSITINTNPMFNFYNDDAAASVHVGRMSIEGSMTLPWNPGDTNVEKNWVIGKFLDGQVFRIAWFWGQSDAGIELDNDYDLPAGATLDRYKNDSAATAPKNFVSVVVNAKITDYEVAGDNELQVECSFQGVKDATNDAVKVYSLYDDTLLNLSA